VPTRFALSFSLNQPSSLFEQEQKRYRPTTSSSCLLVPTQVRILENFTDNFVHLVLLEWLEGRKTTTTSVPRTKAPARGLSLLCAFGLFESPSFLQKRPLSTHRLRSARRQKSRSRTSRSAQSLKQSLQRKRRRMQRPHVKVPSNPRRKLKVRTSTKQRSRRAICQLDLKSPMLETRSTTTGAKGARVAGTLWTFACASLFRVIPLSP